MTIESLVPGEHRAGDVNRCTSVRDLPHLTSGRDYLCERQEGHEGPHMAVVGGDGCRWTDDQARGDSPMGGTPAIPAWMSLTFLPDGILDDIAAARGDLERLVHTAMDEWLCAYGNLFVAYDDAVRGHGTPDTFDEHTGYAQLHLAVQHVGDVLVGFADEPDNGRRPEMVREAAARVNARRVQS